jgi:hypothetical protein
MLWIDLKVGVIADTSPSHVVNVLDWQITPVMFFNRYEAMLELVEGK